MNIIRTKLNSGDRSFILKYVRNGDVGAEVGVWRGEFSEAILNNVNLKKFYLIDAWISYEKPHGTLKQNETGKTAAEDRYKETLSKFKNRDNVEIIREYSDVAAKKIEDGSLDWVYIDAGHTYEDVKQDLESYYPKVKSGGYIFGDDYNPKVWKGLVTAVNEFFNSKGELVNNDKFQFIVRKG